MILLRNNSERAFSPQGVAATIGNFDGVHLGHQQLLRELKVQANAMNLPMAVVLFEPQPREYFQGTSSPARLLSLREKIAILKQCQVDIIYPIRFNQTVAQTSAEDFARHYLFDFLNTKYLLVGKDFRFGKNRSGDVDLLLQLGRAYQCEVKTFNDLCIDGERVSSTKIRSALDEADFSCAGRCLGRQYSITGRVIQGDGRGRQWGIPTANIKPNRLVLPLKGVFVVEVRVGARMIRGVANMGQRPTVAGTKNILEIHLFDFNESLYGQQLEVFFLHKLRDEVKFTTIDALIAQIHKDITAAKAFLMTPNAE